MPRVDYFAQHLVQLPLHTHASASQLHFAVPQPQSHFIAVQVHSPASQHLQELLISFSFS